MCVEKKMVLPSLRSSRIEVAHLLAPQRVEPGHRLVEDHQLRIAHHRLRKPDPLQHPLGELAQRPAARVIEPNTGDQMVGARPPRRRRERAQRADEVEKLLGRQVVIKIGTLR